MSGEKQETALAQYGSFDLAAMEEVEKALPESSGGFWKPKEGKNVVRFLPPKQGMKPVFIWYKHFFQAGGERKSVICPKYQNEEPCGICAKGQRLRASGNRADQRAARAYEPKAQVYANIVDRKNPEKGVQVWSIPQGLFKKLRKQIDAADVGKVFADPQKGYDIVIVREGMTKDDTEYEVTVRRESTPLPDAAEFIAAQPDLSTVEELPGDEAMEVAIDGKYDKDGGATRSGGKGNERGGNGKRKPSEETVEADDKDDITY